jgi:hypothetical protein
MAGDPENKASLKGRDNTKGGSGSVRKEEGYVGSKGGEGIRFKMPECVDHSNVRGSASKLKE